MEFEIRIERIVPNGYGIGFSEGQTVFVPLSAPGDLLKVRPREKRGAILFAEIVEILEKSPVRIDAPCQHFGKCGGCDFQHMNYETQLESKAAIIADCFRRLGRLELEVPIEVVPSPDQFAYRARVEWHYDSFRRRFGFYRRLTRDVIDMDGCPVLTDGLNAEMKRIRSAMEWDDLESGGGVLSASSGGKVSTYSPEFIEPMEELSFQTNGETFFYDARTFFQANHLLIGKLIELAIGDRTGGAACELYSGSGLFTIPLARKFARVASSETDERAVSFARKNIEHARIENVSLDVADSAEWLAEIPEAAGEFDLLLLDPPRAGAQKKVTDQILRLKPKEISYVSCEPSTLARDLGELCRGGYKIDKVTAVDMFPQTHHVETVVALSLNG
jgi:23S rRNA (uracil1939-C5)-methyltransferase